jgi:hypothetical protein
MLLGSKDRSNLSLERELYTNSCEIGPDLTLFKGKRLEREAREKLFTVSRAIVQYEQGDQALCVVGLKVVKADVISGAFAI